MKLTILKTGRYSVHPALGPIEDFVEGQEYDKADLECSAMMIESGWAKASDKVDEEVDESPSEDDEKPKDEEPDTWTPDLVEKELLAKISGTEDDDEKKQIIQDWGVVNLDHKVSRAKSVENMILELKESVEG